MADLGLGGAGGDSQPGGTGESGTLQDGAAGGLAGHERSTWDGERVVVPTIPARFRPVSTGTRSRIEFARAPGTASGAPSRGVAGRGVSSGAGPRGGGAGDVPRGQDP
ncbi:hypothetical protein SNE510_49990 [Streptomyces sp. NE5-10]|nr:hypothetical protein SNE510_49990 [Streptomyces sp. NE5-10]